MTDLNTTVLYDLHLELGAKMVPFSGYHMPIQYSSGIINEHLHCRVHAGLFDVSHMGQCFITGENVAEQLEGLTPSKITSLTTNKQLYTVLTNDQGGVIDDIIITRLADKFLLITNGACKQKVFKHLHEQLSPRCKVTVLEEQALLALQGPEANLVMQSLCVQATELKFMQATETEIAGKPCMISRSGYTGEDGFEISIGNEHAVELAKQLLAFEQVSPIGLGARDTLRLEAGLSLYGHELNEQNTPIDSGLQWLIKRAEGYLGAAVIQEQLAAGARFQRIGLIIDGKIPVREGCELLNDKGETIGVVTSGSYSPTLGKPIALAQVSSIIEDTQFFAQIRNHKISLDKTDLPFVEQQYRR